MGLEMDDKEFIHYANNIVNEGNKRGALLRLLGSVAFYIHCPAHGYLQEKAHRNFTDLDFAAYYPHTKVIRNILETMGFEEDREVAVVYARSRLIYNHPSTGLHIDVFIDRLDFCHQIPWAGRLEIDDPTIPLAELLLEKMQIVKLNEKDVIDTIMLFREHSIGNDDKEIINADMIAAMCSKDWGLWRTITMNLKKVDENLQSFDWLIPEDREVVHSRIGEVQRMIDAAPKSIKWNMRSKVGDKVKWYNDSSEAIE
jgi:hypothetical protein